ncbi:MAG: hypothetical protein AAF497_04345, partial [Planctomycetota bacterium]
MSKLKTFHYPIAPSIRTHDGPWYEVCDDVVTWRGNKMKADPQSFVALTHSWAIDNDTVFILDQPRRKIDRATFRMLNTVFAVDKTAVYDWKGAIKHADPATFEPLESGTCLRDQELLPGVDFMG